MQEAPPHEWLKRMMKPSVENADNEWLGPNGDVWEVNGPGAQEFHDFHPTKHELITLAKYWAEAAIDTEFGWFLGKWLFSSELRSQPFAWQRVNRIRALIGKEVDEAIEHVYQTYGAKQDKQAWEAFRHRSASHQTALREAFEQSICRIASR